MYRNITAYLEQWKNNPYRKPLVVQGSRQVGKTYTILEFGNTHFDNVAYFNFQTNPKLISAFDENISPSYIISILSHLSGKNISPNHTLIFLDEIQLCERALTSLKYFCEEAPEYHVIAAVSLLGIAVNREKFAFPVGKIDRCTMHPMTLDEFLIAIGQTDLCNNIQNCYENNIAMPAVLHDQALKFYRQYLAIGGMPEVVARFIETNDFNQVRHLQDTIQMDYLDDMSKYQGSSTEIKKTRLTYSTIATQLSRKNTRFQYKIIKTGARAAEYENAISWLVSGNLISQVYRIEKINKPLDNYKDIDDFKIYISDMGILCAQKDIKENDIFFMEQELSDFKGGMTENYVNSQLVSNSLRTFYWRNDNGTNEVDFVVNLDGNIIPIEVKSGENVTSTSLLEYIKLFKPAYSIRISERNFGFENNIKSIPLYAAFCIKSQQQY